MSPGHLFSRWLSLASSQQWRFRHIAERTCYERKAARHTVEPLSWPPRLRGFASRRSKFPERRSA